jgi:hypothetical protein
MADLIYPGQRLLVEVKFFLQGVPTDPTVARCLIEDPTGSQTVLTYPAATFTRRDAGFFEANITVTLPGTWYFRGEASGIVDSASETSIEVVPSNF